MNNQYQITISLTEKEFDALALLGMNELRSPRLQAHYLLRAQLVTLGLMPSADNPLTAHAHPQNMG